MKKLRYECVFTGLGGGLTLVFREPFQPWWINILTWGLVTGLLAIGISTIMWMWMDREPA